MWNLWIWSGTCSSTLVSLYFCKFHFSSTSSILVPLWFHISSTVELKWNLLIWSGTDMELVELKVNLQFHLSSDSFLQVPLQFHKFHISSTLVPLHFHSSYAPPNMNYAPPKSNWSGTCKTEVVPANLKWNWCGTCGTKVELAVPIQFCMFHFSSTRSTSVPQVPLQFHKFHFSSTLVSL